MNPLVLGILSLGVGALAISADERGATRPFYVLKPLATLLLIGVAFLVPEPVSPAYRALVVAGLALSLAGDVFLMLPSDRFLAGLASFLLAHVCYIAAFASPAGFQPSLVAALPFALLGGVVFAMLLPHLGPMRIPAGVYALAIAVMGWQALAQWLAVGGTRALLGFVGAALFVASDSLLALDRFRAPLPHRTALVLGTYYPAQFLIALSVGEL